VKSKHTVIDNFLSDDEFVKVKDVMMGDLIPWYLNVGKVFADDNGHQLTHTFYKENCVQSEWISHLKSIIVKLEAVSLLRIKANLTPRVGENKLTEFHVDVGNKQRKGWCTSIFYINTNDGYTALKDGTKIESVANRLLTFSSSTMHAGSACTNENVRILINFNYIV
jgi:hypothetical protein